MRRHRHRQRQCTFGTGFFGRGHGAFHRSGIARNHHLAGRIEVHRLGHLPLRGGGADLAHGIVFQPQNGGHRALPLRHGRLHQLGTQAHQAHGIGKIQAARGHQRAVFAQAVPGHGGGKFAARFEVGAVSGHACGQHQGLGVDGLADERGIFAVHHRPQILAQRGGSLLKGLAHNGHAVETGHHIQALRALAGEEKGKRHGVSLSY